MKLEKKKNKKLLIVALALAIGLPLVGLPQTTQAQQTASAIVSTAVPFMLIAPDARASGMGDEGTGDPVGIDAIYYNPAGLAFQEGRDIALTHSQWLPQFNQNDLFYDNLNFKWNDSSKFGGTIAANITFLNLGTFEYTTEASPTPIAQFHSFEYAVTAAYATKLSSDWAFGGSVRYIESVLSTLHVANEQSNGVGESVSFDLSALWKPDSTYVDGIANALQIGFLLADVGPKIKYVDALQADPLPTELRVGASYKLYSDEYNEITLASDVGKLLVHRAAGSITADPLPKSLITAWDDSTAHSFMWSTGMEYWYDQLLALRAGYYTEGSQVGGRNYLTFGAGLRYDVYQFDFSYIDALVQDSPLANTLRFTLGIKF
ncbi:MAG TPA: PorV/PorQ family protein [Candidatus Kapabacteria bacterium]|nr:PorV/PorQ family protein [Candidatus Kapabacteria bacterium]